MAVYELRKTYLKNVLWKYHYGYMCGDAAQLDRGIDLLHILAESIMNKTMYLSAYHAMDVY